MTRESTSERELTTGRVRDLMQEQPNCCGETVLLRVTEVAKMLGLGRSKVYEMTKTGELPVLKVGTAVRVPKQELLDWIKRHTSKVA